MKLVKSVLVAMLLGIMTIQVAWALNVDKKLWERVCFNDLKGVKYYIRKGASVDAMSRALHC